MDLSAGRFERPVLEWRITREYYTRINDADGVIDMNNDQVTIEGDGRVFRFDRVSGEAVEIERVTNPDMDDDERGGRDPRAWLNPNFTIVVVGDVLQIRSARDDQLINRIPMPAPVWIRYGEDGIGEDGRFVFARAGQTMVVVFDRQTRRWLGRFDASSNASHRSHLRRIELVDNRWLVISTKDIKMRILMFDLYKYVE